MVRSFADKLLGVRRWRCGLLDARASLRLALREQRIWAVPDGLAGPIAIGPRRPIEASTVPLGRLDVDSNPMPLLLK